MRSALLGFMAGMLTLGYITWLSDWVLISGICILPLLLLLYHKSMRAFLATRQFLKSLLLALIFVGSFIFAVGYGQSALKQALQQRLTEPLHITAVVNIEQISDGVGDNWSQIVRVVGGKYHHQQWLLYTPYTSWQQGSKAIAPPMRPNQLWQVELKLKPAHSKASFQAFDVEKWLLTQHITATGTIVSAKQLDHSQRQAQKIQSSTSLLDTFQSYMQQQRLYTREHVSRFDSPAKGVLLGLLTGDRSLIDDQTTALYRQMGISHLLAISGPHVLLAALMVTWLCRYLLGFFPRLYLLAERPRWLIPIFFSVVLLYACLAGFDIPAQRTVLMVALSCGLFWWRQRWDNLLILLLSASILLLVDPLAVLSPAFWLSFGAVAILLSMSRATPLETTHKLAALSAELKWFVLLQWRLFLLLTPLVLLCFGQVSLLSPLINIIAIPFLSLVILPLDLLAYLVYQCSPMVADAIWQLALSLLVHFHNLLLWVAQEFPHALRPFYLNWAALAALFIGVIILALPKGILPKWWVAFLLIPVIWPYHQQAALVVHVLDVGQGLSIIIKTPNHSMVVDTGAKAPMSEGMGEQVVLPALRVLGIHQLDKLLLTHLDNDHVGGAPAIIQALSIKQIMTSEKPAFFTGQIPIGLCRAGQSWWWDDVHFKVLSPWVEQTDLDQNDASCILMVETRATALRPSKRMLIMGDAGFYTEYLLQQKNVDLKADILILGHHGSKNSSSSPFLSAVQPKRAVVSAGYLNAYQHPAPVLLARLKEQGAVVDSVVSGGTLSYYFNAEKFNDGKAFIEPIRYRDHILWLQRDNDADGGLKRRSLDR